MPLKDKKKESDKRLPKREIDGSRGQFFEITHWQDILSWFEYCFKGDRTLPNQYFSIAIRRFGNEEGFVKAFFENSNLVRRLDKAMVENWNEQCDCSPAFAHGILVNHQRLNKRVSEIKRSELLAKTGRLLPVLENKCLIAIISNSEWRSLYARFYHKFKSPSASKKNHRLAKKARTLFLAALQSKIDSIDGNRSFDLEALRDCVKRWEPPEQFLAEIMSRSKEAKKEAKKQERLDSLVHAKEDEERASEEHGEGDAYLAYKGDIKSKPHSAPLPKDIMTNPTEKMIGSFHDFQAKFYSLLGEGGAQHQKGLEKLSTLIHSLEGEWEIPSLLHDVKAGLPKVDSKYGPGSSAMFNKGLKVDSAKTSSQTQKGVLTPPAALLASMSPSPKEGAFSIKGSEKPGMDTSLSSGL